MRTSSSWNNGNVDHSKWLLEAIDRSQINRPALLLPRLGLTFFVLPNAASTDRALNMKELVMAG